MSLEEAILERVRRLPPAKQEEILRFAEGLQHASEARILPSRDRSREIDWLKHNRNNYLGQWIVVEGDRLVAADADALTAYNAAADAGIEVPFLIHVVPDDPLPFVPAWL